MKINLKNGQTYSHHFTFSQEEVIAFADVTGDKNPIHLDEAFAKNTIFKKPIIHGFLGGSIFSKVLGTLFPGTGTVYLTQTMSFLRPMYTGLDYSAVFTVKEIMLEKKRALITTEITDTENNLTLTGEALIFNEDI